MFCQNLKKMWPFVMVHEPCTSLFTMEDGRASILIFFYHLKDDSALLPFAY